MTPTSPPETASRRSIHSYGEPNETLRIRLQNLKDKEDLTNNELAALLGYKEGTPVSKYLNNKWDRTGLNEFENRVSDMLRNRSQKQKHHVPILRTSVIKQVENVLDSIRSTGLVGVIHGEAGMGKTTGTLSYIAKNPTSILVTANRMQNSERGIIQLLIAAYGKHGYSNNRSYWSYLVEQFKGSNRLIIIDHAQRLSKAAVDILFDFHDQTKCPIAFVGNPAILSCIERDSNNHSRALKEYAVTLLEIPKITRHIVDQYTDQGEDIYDLAWEVAKRANKGRLRAVENLLRSAVDHLKNPDLPGGIRGAFQVAVSESIQHRK